MKSTAFARLNLLIAILCQPLFAGSYSNDFESYSNGETNLGGGVTVQTNFTEGVPQVFDLSGNKAFRLTQDQTSSGGYTSFELSDLDPGEAITSFTATFDVLIKDEGGPADGFSFNFGDLNTGSYIGTELEDGYASNGGDVLSVTFDTYDNGADANYNRVGASVNGSEVSGFDTVPLIVDGQTSDPFRVVSISWDGVGNTLSVSYNGSTVYLDDAVTFSPTSGSIFAFGARTGGSNEDVFIDNLSIVTVPELSTGILSCLLLIAGVCGYSLRSRR